MLELFLFVNYTRNNIITLSLSICGILFLCCLGREWRKDSSDFFLFGSYKRFFFLFVSRHIMLLPIYREIIWLEWIYNVTVFVLYFRLASIYRMPMYLQHTTSTYSYVYKFYPWNWIISTWLRCDLQIAWISSPIVKSLGLH